MSADERCPDCRAPEPCDCECCTEKVRLLVEETMRPPIRTLAELYKLGRKKGLLSKITSYR